MSRLLAFASMVAAMSFGTNARAQVDLAWLQQLDSASHGWQDSASRVVVAPSGLVVTILTGVQAPNVETRIQAFDADGTPAWFVDWYAGGDPVYVTDLAVDPSNGDIVAVGTSRTYQGTSPVQGSANFAVARFDGSGAELWNHAWNGPSDYNDYGRRVAVDNGRVIVSGETSSAFLHGELAVIAYSADGALLWSSVVAETASEGGMLGDTLALDPNGDVFTAGSGVGSYPNLDFAVTRLSADGVPQWTRTFGGAANNFDRPYSLAVDSASSVYVGGVVQVGPSSGSYRAALVKWDVGGTLQWSRVGAVAAPTPLAFYEIAVDVRDDVLACGRRFDDVTRGDAYLLKLDGNGETLWERIWAGPHAGPDTLASDNFWALDLDAFGGIVVAGSTASYFDDSLVDADPLVLRLDSDGTERWLHRDLFAFPNADGAADVAFGPNGSVIYSGSMNAMVDGPRDALIVRLDHQSEPYCFGDGSGTGCPCGNASAPADGAGCANSLGRGARLFDTGDASLFNDTLTLRATGFPNAAVIFFQSRLRWFGGEGVVFGDGLQCIAGFARRVGSAQAASGAAAYPPPGGVPVSILGQVISGVTYHYQAIYRNSAAFCTPHQFNLTNGLSIAWGI